MKQILMILYFRMDNHPLLKKLLTDFEKFFKEPWQQYIPVFHYIMVNKQQYQVPVNNMVSTNQLKV